MIPLLLLLSLLPIWRRAGVDKALNTWQFAGEALTNPMKHISVEDAIIKAREAGYLKGL